MPYYSCRVWSPDDFYIIYLPCVKCFCYIFCSVTINTFLSFKTSTDIRVGRRLVADRRGDVNAQCVPASGPPPPQSTPSYVWPLIGIGVLLFLALVVGIIAYLLRYPEIFKNAGKLLYFFFYKILS